MMTNKGQPLTHEDMAKLIIEYLASASEITDVCHERIMNEVFTGGMYREYRPSGYEKVAFTFKVKDAHSATA